MTPSNLDPLEPRQDDDRTTGQPKLRLALAAGDPERERRLAKALEASGEILVTDRCLAAEPLLEAARRGAVDALLVSFDLHRLTQSALEELARSGVPWVLLTPYADADVHLGRRGIALDLDATPEAILAALQTVYRGSRGRRDDETPPSMGEEKPVAAAASDSQSEVLALVSGHGSPGCTTVAVSLAAALGAVAPTVLVDLDLAGASVAAHLDADPTRNLYMLAHAEPQSPREWDHALGQETQPIGARSPEGVILAGPPGPAMRARLTADFLTRVLGELRRRYRYVLLDLGGAALDPQGVQRTALGAADHVLLVASPDVTGLAHAQGALTHLPLNLGVRAEQLALIINRHDGRYHHGRTDIEWVLRKPLAALIPNEYATAQRALLSQQPLVWTRHSRAARSLLDLAGRVHDGQVRLPPDPARRRWPAWPWRWRPQTVGAADPVPVRVEVEEEADYGDEPVSVAATDGPRAARGNGRARVARGSAGGSGPPAG